MVAWVGEVGFGTQPSSDDLRRRAPVQHPLAPSVVRLIVAPQQVFQVAVATHGDRQHLAPDAPVEALHHAVRLRAVGPRLPVLDAEQEAARLDRIGGEAGAAIGEQVADREPERRDRLVEKVSALRSVLSLLTAR